MWCIYGCLYQISSGLFTDDDLSSNWTFNLNIWQDCRFYQSPYSLNICKPVRAVSHSLEPHTKHYSGVKLQWPHLKPNGNVFEFNLHWILIVNSVSQFSGLNLLSAIYPKLNHSQSIFFGFWAGTGNEFHAWDMVWLVCCWLSDGVWLQNNRFQFVHGFHGKIFVNVSFQLRILIEKIYSNFFFPIRKKKIC